MTIWFCEIICVAFFKQNTQTKSQHWLCGTFYMKFTVVQITERKLYILEMKVQM